MLIKRVATLGSVASVASVASLAIIVMTNSICGITGQTTDSTSDSPKLKLVFMIHRHGDRTPIQCYPTDPYRNGSNWLDGWGQLTIRGKERMYRLGQYLRQRYNSFLGISPREVHIRSSAADRCLESVALVMAGLYKPEGRWQWDQDLGSRWQPFPIQTEPRNSDGMLNSGSKCLAAEKELNRIHNSPEVQQYTKQRKATLEYVTRNTGRNVSDLTTAEEIFDVLLIEKENRYQLPRWVDDSTYTSLSQIADMTFYFDFSTKLIQRLRTGLLLKDIVNRIEEVEKNKNVRSNDSSDKKLYIYSTHDTQLALLLNALNVFDKKAPPFGSSILIELRQNNSTLYLHFYYLKDIKEGPIVLHLPICSNDTESGCPVKKFVESVNDLLINDWTEECREKQYILDSNTVTPYMIGSLLTMSVMTLVFILYIFFRPKNKEIVYHMLPIR